MFSVKRLLSLYQPPWIVENLYKNDKSFQILTLKLVTIHVGGNNIETVLVGGNNAKTGVCIYVLCKKAPIDPLENLYKTENWNLFKFSYWN